MTTAEEILDLTRTVVHQASLATEVQELELDPLIAEIQMALADDGILTDPQRIHDLSGGMRHVLTMVSIAADNAAERQLLFVEGSEQDVKTEQFLRQAEEAERLCYRAFRCSCALYDAAVGRDVTGALVQLKAGADKPQWQ